MSKKPKLVRLFDLWLRKVMNKPGKAPVLDSQSRITDISGVSVGHWTDSKAETGCTVILFDRSCTASYHVAGGAPGSSETDLLKPSTLVAGIDALLFTGGSAFGLEASSGVRRFLEERGRGFKAGNFTVPIVPAAVIFDLNTGDGSIRPGPEEGYFAAKEAISGETFPEGSVGAGTGARVGKYLGVEKSIKAGLASRSLNLDGGITIGALMVANCYGAIVDAASASVIAAPVDDKGTPITYMDANVPPPRFGNTAIGVVVTDAALTKDEASRIAIMAHDGIARAVSPSHTPYDGDMIFVVSTGDKKGDVAKLGAWAAELTQAAITATVTR